MQVCLGNPRSIKLPQTAQAEAVLDMGISSNGAGAAISPIQPSGSSPDPQGVDAANPGVVLPSSVPSHKDSSQCEFGIYTSCTKPLFFSFLVLDLAASLLQLHVCVMGCKGQEAAPETLAELGRSGFPSLPLVLPREQKDGVFQHQTGRDSLGKKHEVFSPFEREFTAEGGQGAAVRASTGRQAVASCL